MGLFGHRFPYTNFHELNLDWILEQLKEMEQNTVLSVNGQTGEVVLYQDPTVTLPEITENAWQFIRTADGTTVGISFRNGNMYLVNGSRESRIYTEDNPPAYPVTSVNGQTGDVTITIPVTSVNGQTGAVTINIPVLSVNGKTGNVILFDTAFNQLPAVTESATNFYRQVDSAGSPLTVGVQVDKTKMQRIAGTNRIDVYDTENPPPYPVTSVNGQTGAVTIAIPVTSVNGQTGAVLIPLPFNTPYNGDIWVAAADSLTHKAGMQRGTADGTASFYVETTAGTIDAYVKFVSTDGQTTVTNRLLTLADIPSSAGVVSVNGKTNVVVIYGSDIPVAVDDVNYTVADALGDLKDEIDAANDSIDTLQEGLAIIVDGDTASVAVPVGAYAYIKNNTHGLADGLYTNVSASAFPVSGGTADSTVFSAVAEGALNAAGSTTRRDITSEFTLLVSLNYFAAYQTGNLICIVVKGGYGNSVPAGGSIKICSYPPGYTPVGVSETEVGFVDTPGDLYGVRLTSDGIYLSNHDSTAHNYVQAIGLYMI